MASRTYLNIILSVIALNLILISFCQLDVFPEAKAKKEASPERAIQSQKMVKVPVNSDGSIDVRVKRLPKEMNVILKEVEMGAFMYEDVPVEIKDQPVEVESH